MRPVLFVIAFSVPTFLGWPAAVAIGMPLGPVVHGQASHALLVKNDKYKVKYKWKRGRCKYEYKADRKGVKEKYKCK